MSDREVSRSRSPSMESRGSPPSEGSKHSKMSKSKRSRSYSRSPSRSRSRSRGRRYRRSYSRSRSRSYSRRRRHHHSRSRSGSRNRSRYRRRSRHSRSRSNEYRRRDGYSDRRRGYYRSHSRSPMSGRRRHQGNRENPEPTRCLGIFGLSLYTQERELRDVFSKFGALEEVQVVYDRQSGRSRGFAFIYFRSTDDSIEAKERCNGIEIDGRRIRVDYSITERAHTPTPGIYLGKPTTRRRSPSPPQRYARYSYSRSRSRSYSPRWEEERKMKIEN
ncbi:transformer-2 protein homolog alpha-like [Liolophura sinensis]|uniref:transformer-2 protein homolog alpha-like n=1 Tax=Liolophura sinensis TaxID=3198878 RepID=UPI00315869A6